MLPIRILFPLILLLCVIGIYSTKMNIFDLGVMIGFGLMGYLLRKWDYELAPFILALVLGPLFEQSLRQSLILSAKEPMIFFRHPFPYPFGHLCAPIDYINLGYMEKEKRGDLDQRILQPTRQPVHT